jgi:hypothetical protein
MTRIGLFPVLAVMLAGPLAAQQVNPAVSAHHAPWDHGWVHYGKWASAVLAATFIGLGAHEVARSDDAFHQLLTTCRVDVAKCVLDPSGAYVNPTNEQLYQTSLDYERRARVRLLAGQASLMLAAGLFLADRGRHADEPDNVPYHLTVEPGADATRVGVRVQF